MTCPDVGLVSAVSFFLPLSIATFWTAWVSGIASVGEIVLGLLIGGATLAYPIVMLKVKSLPYFRQDAHA